MKRIIPITNCYKKFPRSTYVPTQFTNIANDKRNMLSSHNCLIFVCILYNLCLFISSSSSDELNLKTILNNTYENGTNLYVLASNRKAFLTIDYDKGLRAGNTEKKKKVESLCYQEFDDKGNKINEFLMYNLADVATFFKTYLNTEICYGSCKNRS